MDSIKLMTERSECSILSDHRCSQFRATYLFSSWLVHKDKLFSTSHPESGDESFLDVF